MKGPKDRRTKGPRDQRTGSGPLFFGLSAFAACLFLLVLGAKWATFERFGSPMPDWDQWDAEGSHLLIPWFERDEFLSHLFAPHNEHRVVLTKLQNLTLTLLNGQWDARLESVTNAILHSVLAVAFWLLAYRWLAGRREVGGAEPPGGGEEAGTRDAARPAERHDGPRGDVPTTILLGALFVLTAVLFGLPVAWQNVLGGFHSQQYWLLLLSFAAIVTLPFSRPSAPGWWVGAVAAVLALGSMGSGFVAAAVVLVVAGWRLWQREATVRAMWPSLLVASAVTLTGLLTRTEAPWHDSIKARSAQDFVFSIVHSLQWPLRDHHWAAGVLWLPWVVLALRVARTRRGAAPGESTAMRPGGRERRVDETLVALGGWVLVQIVATAYARGVGADYPASRYMDTLAFGAMVNGIALAWLWRQRTAGLAAANIDPGTADPSQPGPWALKRRGGRLGGFGGRRGPAMARRAIGVLALGWVVTLGFGLQTLLRGVVGIELPDAKSYYTKAERHMRRYLATNDPRELAFPDIPFPTAEGLIERLASPHLRALMPVPLRAPLELAETPASAPETPAFLENDTVSAEPEPLPQRGLSPRTPPLELARTWGSYVAPGAGVAGLGEWRSAPLTAPLKGWLVFEIAGLLGHPDGGVTLELRSAATDRRLAKVRPSRLPRDTWRAAYVRAPREPFVVVARDEHAARWFAFSAPVEMGRLSYAAWWAVKQGMLLAWLSGAAALGLAGLVVRRHLRPAAVPRTPSLPPVTLGS
jgi:hypothetical protein